MEAIRAPLDAILAMREEYRREMDSQIVHDSWHARGFTTSWLLRTEGEIVGYGAVGGAPREAKDVVKELWTTPAARVHAAPLFRALVAASGARWIEAQTNDTLLSRLLDAHATAPAVRKILFAAGETTQLAPPLPNARVRPIAEQDAPRTSGHAAEPAGEWEMECDGEIVATGGLTFYYNPPYGDLYMEVAPAYRRRGVGSYLVQELKRICRDMGCVPAARCDEANVASRRTLERAGMVACARLVRARLCT